MIQAQKFECGVCCCQYNNNEAYSIGNCKHFFCKYCCFQHIESRLSSFQSIKCLTIACQQKLTKQSSIYKHLSDKTKKKVAKYQQFIMIQNNRNLKPCQKQDCSGVINIQSAQINQKQNQLFCNQCLTRHCSKCYKLSHQGNQRCSQPNLQQRQKQQKLMKMLNYRKCPSCEIWVQKSGGCRYLTCKCKTQFCFTCGQKFETDPCRKMNLRHSQSTIWNLVKITKNLKKPNSISEYLFFLPKSLIKFLLVLFFTSLSGLIGLGILFGVFIPLVYLASPAFIIVILGQVDLSKQTKLILRILTVLLYPVVGFLASIGLFLIFLTYPLMRILISAHMYDQIDRFMYGVTQIYLRGLNCILAI